MSLREPPVDALVVGAGPVGLVLASELRRHGASCRIVDRAAAPTHKSKAVILHSRTIEHLDQLALEQEFTERGTALHGVSFFQGGRRVTQLRPGARAHPHGFRREQLRGGMDPRRRADRGIALRA